MLKLRPNKERGHTNLGWLDSRHSFSFAEYYDRQQMGFRSLRVINQDRVRADSGFPLHPHQEMEIISLVLKGELQHRDSIGNAGIIHADEVQRMTAGTGIQHSEWNPAPEQEVEFLQIWILPEKKGLTPSYQQRAARPLENQQTWTLLASPDGEKGSISIHQDIALWRVRLQAGDKTRITLRPGRHAWLQLVRDDLQIDEQTLRQGDGAAISEVPKLEFSSLKGADFLLFDLA